MARTPQKSEDKIRHRSYLYAYLWIKKGIYYAVIHDKRKSLHIKEGKTLAEKSSARKIAMDMLDELVLQHLQKTSNGVAYVLPQKEVVTPPQVTPPPKPPKKVVIAKINKSTTLVSVVQEYILAKKKTVAPGTLKVTLAVLKRYFTSDLDIDDYHAIRKLIVTHQQRFNYAESTARKHHHRLHAFFDWAIKAGYTTRNPMDAVPTPRVPQKDVVFPTWEEFNRIVEHYRTGVNYKIHHDLREENIRFWTVLAKTGMRIQEAFTLRVEDFNEQGFKIDGKRKHFAESRIRWFIYEAVPGVKELMEDCIKHAQPDGRLWSWRYYHTPATNLRDCVRALNMNEAYSPHSLRRLAKWWWEVELGLPAHVCNLLAGHSFAVRNKYHRTPTMEDLAAYLKPKN